MLTLRYLVKRTEKLELLLPASILVVRKSIKITVATMLIAAVKPIVAIVVTVVTVVTVVITFLFTYKTRLTQEKAFVKPYYLKNKVSKNAFVNS